MMMMMMHLARAGLIGLLAGLPIEAFATETPRRLDGPAAAVTLGPSALTPGSLDVKAPLSAAVLTSTGGPATVVDQVRFLADWDGREDLTADREAVEVDHSTLGNPVTEFFTRVAVSEHSIANGHSDVQLVHGDSVGNFRVDFDSDGDGDVDVSNTVNIPMLVSTGVSDGFSLQNASGGDATSGTVVITGIAVNPVADMGVFGMCDTVGEITYVAAWDQAGGSLDAHGRPIKTRIFAFGTFELGGGVFAAGALQLLRSPLDGPGGIAVDDDGSLYFHLADLAGGSGAAIFKATETPQDVCATTGRINRAIGPFDLAGDVGLAGGTPLVAPGVRVTNYSGTATTFGNVVAMTNGPCNAVYAALARSRADGDDAATQATEGPFANPAALGPTPSMVIGLADGAGAFDACSSPGGLQPGILPIGDGVADPAQAGVAVDPGVNNFRAFVLGNGPDRRAAGSAVFGSPGDTLKVDMQIDPTVFAGIAVDEAHAVSVISGGTPAGFGSNPSPALGEILKFPDRRPFDRRADFVDLRGDALPDPPANGGNVPDGDSDRFDHVFYPAPPDGGGNPTGLAGLARGFLLYLNRLRDVGTAFPTLPDGMTQADDVGSGPVAFAQFDATEQVAGGDDAAASSTGDDASGGFEFSFAGTPSVQCLAPWTEFYLSSNGRLTFGAGSDDNTPTIPELLSGPPSVNPAWSDLNPGARGTSVASFPVQALGFADVNAFKVRWIDVPQFGHEACGGRVSVAVTLFDDGTGNDESNPGVPEGPTDGANRAEGSGQVDFEYCRVDMLATAGSPVLVGYARGGQDPATPNVGESDWSEASRRADLDDGLVGDGTKGILYELFNAGVQPAPQMPGSVDLDLRFASNDPGLTTAATQPDPSRDAVSLLGADCNGVDLACAYEIAINPLAIAGAGDFDQTLVAHGGVAPFTFALASGTLPDGVTLGADGRLSGSSTVVGPFGFVVTATDAQQCVGTAAYAFQASCGVHPAFGSIGCRLAAIGTQVDALPGKKTKRKLARLVKKAGKLLSKAQKKAEAGKTKPAGRQLKGAARTLVRFGKLLGKKKAQKELPPDTIAALTAAADAVRADAETLRGSL